MSQSVDELFDRMGTKVTQAVAKHKNDEIRGGFVELPPISSGVAKLLRMEFYAEEGVLKFRAVGSVDAPLYAEGGIPCKGLETAQFSVLSEADPEAGVADVLDVIGKMVGTEKRDQLCTSFGTSARGLNQIVQAITGSLAKNPVYFRFSNKFEENKTGRLDPKTQQPYKGRFWQRWYPAVPGYTPMGGPVTVTAPPGMASANGTHPVTPPRTGNTPAPAPWSERNKPVAPTPKIPNVATPQSPVLPKRGDGGDVYDLNAGDDTPDVNALVARANNSDMEAMDELERLAAKLGYTEDDCRDPNVSYDDIGQWILSGTRKGGDGGEANRFTKDQVVKFLPPNNRYKNDPTKRHDKPVDCVVHAIGEDGTLTLHAVGNPERQWREPENSPYVTVPVRQK